MILALILAVACPHPARSRTEVHHFMQLHPCPGGPDRGSQRRCRGYVVDHIKPLACCGKDEPANMQWQTVKEAKAKDRWELDCRRYR